jgi:hypothetical protein
MSTSPRTARSLLFDDPPAGQPVGLAAALADDDTVRAGVGGARRLGAAGVRAVTTEVGEVADGLMEIDLGDALVLGWKRHTALLDAAHRTLAEPGREEVVLLAGHAVTSSHDPSVDLVVDGHVVNSFEFDVDIDFLVTGVSAVVRAGCLAALRSGRCDVTVAVRLEGATLVHRRRTFDAALLVPLPRPVPLVDTVVVPRQGLRTDPARRDAQRPL